MLDDVDAHEQLVTCLHALKGRLDVSRPQTAERVLNQYAQIVRWGLLSLEELRNPQWYAKPIVCFSGPPYSGKTSASRLFRALASKRTHSILSQFPGVVDDDLRRSIHHLLASQPVQLVVPDTDRPMRTQYGNLTERQGDPYHFHRGDELYRALQRDQEIYQCRVNGDRSQRRQYGYWSHFGGNIGDGHLYGMPIDRLKAYMKSRGMLFFEGSVEPAQFLMTLFPLSFDVFFVPSWLQPDGDQWIQPDDDPTNEALASFRLNQSSDERAWRMSYALIVTHWMTDDIFTNQAGQRQVLGCCEADHIFYPQEGSRSLVLAVKIAATLFHWLSQDVQWLRLTHQLHEFVCDQLGEIDRRSYEGTFDVKPISRLAQFMSTSRLPGYVWVSPHTGLEPPVPRPAVSPRSA